MPDQDLVEKWWHPAVSRTALDFQRQFHDWASHYDETVTELKGRFSDVFENYNNVIERTAELVGKPAGSLVIDVGSGTGNLTKELLKHNYAVYGVEPSYAMREIARAKLPEVTVEDGHFLKLPFGDAEADSIVSSYAFHHLSDSEKLHGILEMLRVLKPDGRIVMADIAFLSEAARLRTFYLLGLKGRADFVAELEAEPYSTVVDLEHIFNKAGCSTRWEQLSPWAWVVAAERSMF